MIHEAVAMVAAIFSGGMQPHHHLVPPTTFAQVLRKPRQVAFGQTLELLHHFLSPVHRVETLDPKHNLNLDFQWEHAAKRFVLRIDQPSAVHSDTVNNLAIDLSPWCSLVYPPVSTNHALALDPLVQGGQGVPMGGSP